MHERVIMNSGYLLVGLLGLGGYIAYRHQKKKLGLDVRHVTAGARPAWVGDLVAFDRKTDGLFEIYTMKPDGTDIRCVTFNRPGELAGHVGNPAISPDGEWIAFCGENENGNHEPNTIPGRSCNNDLWIMTVDGSRFYHMTRVPADDGGTLHPHFSPDGKKLTWSEMYIKPQLKPLDLAKIFGSCRLMIADFEVVGGDPVLSNITEYIPGDEVFYENHGLSPDGKKWIFTSNMYDNVPVADADIYTLDLINGDVRKLTDNGYNEHAHYSPDGKTISWMKGSGSGRYVSDLWLMNKDGSNKRRLTYFNDPGADYYLGETGMTGDNEWSPDGKRILTVFLHGTDEDWQNGTHAQDLFMISL